MRWPLIAMAGMSIVLAVVVGGCFLRAADLSWRSQEVYTANTGGQGPTQKQQDAANVLSQQSLGLQQVITPFASGSFACGLGILLVLGRRWQLRATTTTSLPVDVGQGDGR